MKIYKHTTLMLLIEEKCELVVAFFNNKSVCEGKIFFQKMKIEKNNYRTAELTLFQEKEQMCSFS